MRYALEQKVGGNNKFGGVCSTVKPPGNTHMVWFDWNRPGLLCQKFYDSEMYKRFVHCVHGRCGAIPNRDSGFNVFATNYQCIDKLFDTVDCHYPTDDDPAHDIKVHDFEKCLKYKRCGPEPNWENRHHEKTCTLYAVAKYERPRGTWHQPATLKTFNTIHKWHYCGGKAGKKLRDCKRKNRWTWREVKN